MPSKKLMTLLRSFSGYELQRFGKYLQSPYFNESEDLVKLFELLAEEFYEPKNEAEKDNLAKKQAIWKSLYGEKTYNDGHIRRLFSELIRHVQSYLALERFRKEPIQEQLLLLEILNEPDFDLHFAGVVRQSIILLEKMGLRDGNFHYYKSLLEEHLYQFTEKSDRSPEMLRSLENADFHLDCYYVSRKLRHYCDALGYRNFLSIEENINLPPDFLHWLERSKYLTEPIVNAYFLVTQMFLYPDEEKFYDELKKLLKENQSFFRQGELKSLYIHLINYCIDTKINKGRIKFFEELFGIYDVMLNCNILTEKGVIDPQHYKLIISVGLQVKKFDWVENFIQGYTEKLPPEEQVNARIYNLAKVHFQQQHYEKVIELLREVEYQNLTYALGGKLMLLKTYYELNEYLALDSLIDSFRIYLRRNKLISKEVRQQYFNVLRFVKKLSAVMPGDREAIAKIRQEIDACKALADKAWILQKVAELEK